MKIFGIAVFKGDTFVGELSSSQTLYHLIISNKFKSSVINIPSPFSDIDYISLYITKATSKNKAIIVNGSPYITCDVKISARVISSSISANYLTNENLKMIQDYANSYFKANIEEYLYKTSVEFRSDIAGLGKYAVRNYKTMDDWQKYNWLENYKNSFFNVNVHTNVISSYLILGNNRVEDNT